MKRLRIVGLLVIVVLLSLGMTTPVEDRRDIYGGFIDKEVHQCAKRSKQLCTSKFPSIQASSAIDCLKAAFLNFHKEELVAMMVDKDVGTKDYQMEIFLNNQFLTILNKATYQDDSGA